MKLLKILDCGDRFKYQGPRFKELGPESGEEFRDDFFIPWLNDNKGEELTVDFEGTQVYTPSFLEECFGGAIRKGFVEVKTMKFINIKSEELTRLNNFISKAKPQ